MEMKYNVIGDIHGRTNWKELVKDECINIFTGDYFDPYERYTFEEMKNNFLDIVSYKHAHPQTILLLGNHDLHYIYGAESTRYDRSHDKEIKELFTRYKYSFQLAFATRNYLITHAGVTRDWVTRRFPELKSFTPRDLSKAINKIWNEERFEYFMFYYNSMRGDYYGTSPTQSCIWVRPETLISHNVFKTTQFKQVVGHTQYEEITEQGGIVFVDVLGSVNKSYQFEDII